MAVQRKRVPRMVARAKAPEAAAVQASLPSAASITAAEAADVAQAVVAAAPATQVKRPWRATARTALQLVLGLAPMVPLIVGASGVDQAAPPVAGALAISLAVTRVMSLPAVEQFLQQFAPWLAAAPPAPPA